MTVDMQHRWLVAALILLALGSTALAGPAPDPNVVRATIGGMVVEAVAAGDAVEEGTPLVVVRTVTKPREVAARAPRDGVVAEVLVRAGARIRVGEPVVRLSPDR
jgi:3-methylcrotonyl-CoA carboxylase alpha subunit